MILLYYFVKLTINCNPRQEHDKVAILVLDFESASVLREPYAYMNMYAAENHILD